jgi:hypothetical protein
MSHLLSLGAINKNTGKYIQPKIANKKDEYICIDCNKDLILCQGEVRKHYFRHKVDCVKPCHRYSNPSETQIHKDAKLLLKNLLETKIYISFIRKCVSCNGEDEFEIPEIGEGSLIELEYRFEFNGSIKIADVAYIHNNKILCIFEIYNTHKTCSENRPEPWFEIDAETLIKLSNDNNLNSLQIPCIRCEKCDKCIETENANLKFNNIEKYVRIKLGQTIFPTPILKNCENKNKDCNCEKCQYNVWLYNVWKRKGHLRIDYDAREDITNNKNIMEIFSEDFINKKIVIHSAKGHINAYVISILNYNKYDYWNERWNYDDMRFPCEKIINFSGCSTVEIIIELIKYCENVSSIKQEKMNTIKNKIIYLNDRPFWQNKINSEDDSDVLRSMRYLKQDRNQELSLRQEFEFIENDIDYTEFGCNVILIEHPVFHTKLKRSLVHNKTFYKGKWRNDISLKLIITWYNAIYDLLDNTKK